MNRGSMLLQALAAALWTVLAAASLPAQHASPQARQEIANAQALMGRGQYREALQDPVPPGDLAEARRMVADPRRALETIAPDFSFTTLGGARISSGALRGKVVLLDFWGTWCEACVSAEPAIASLYQKFSREPFELIAISSDSDDAAWRSFIAKNKMVWPEYRDASEQIIHAFSVYYFPTYIVIDPDGIVRYRTSGYGQGTYAEIVAAIRRALEARPTEEEGFLAWWP
jgi:thiol-disulfide isomerase/thioredoxin